MQLFLYFINLICIVTFVWSDKTRLYCAFVNLDQGIIVSIMQRHSYLCYFWYYQGDNIVIYTVYTQWRYV